MTVACSLSLVVVWVRPVKTGLSNPAPLKKGVAGLPDWQSSVGPTTGTSTTVVRRNTFQERQEELKSKRSRGLPGQEKDEELIYKDLAVMGVEVVMRRARTKQSKWQH